MLSLADIQTILKDNIKFQETPIPLNDSDYQSYVIEGAKRLYVDSGLDTWDLDFDETGYLLNREFGLVEKEYILVASEIEFYNQIKNYWATLCSYTTNAISITGAGNIFKVINGNVIDLEDRLSKLAFKFTHKQV